MGYILPMNLSRFTKQTRALCQRKYSLNRESSVYSCISDDSAVKKDRVESGHRIELFVITNIHRENDYKENSSVNLLLASLTKKFQE